MPPSRDWPLRVGDIIHQAELILQHTRGATRDAFADDQVLQGNVLYRLGIIGEAVTAIPDGIKALHPNVPWRDIRNMRNVITHVYFGVDLERVWSVVTDDLPALIGLLRLMLPDRPLD